jgi:hypothetical protein
VSIAEALDNVRYETDVITPPLAVPIYSKCMLSIYIYIYIYIYVYIYVYVYMYMYICIYIVNMFRFLVELL